MQIEQARAGVLRDAFVRQKIEEGTTADKLRARYDEVKDDEGFNRRRSTRATSWSPARTRPRR